VTHDFAHVWYSREQTARDIARVMGSMLHLGLHLKQGAIAWAGDSQREYTIGEGSTDGEPLLYMLGTSDCEFPPNAEVLATLIRQAVHEFAETGQRPTCMQWQTWDRVLEDPTADWPK
jgi:Immunity protein Imm1